MEGQVTCLTHSCACHEAVHIYCNHEDCLTECQIYSAGFLHMSVRTVNCNLIHGYAGSRDQLLTNRYIFRLMICHILRRDGLKRLLIVNGFEHVTEKMKGSLGSGLWYTYTIEGAVGSLPVRQVMPYLILKPFQILEEGECQEYHIP